MRNTYTNKPTGKRRTHLFAGFFGIFSSSKNKILLDAQIKEYNTKLSTRPNTYDEEHSNTNRTPTAPHVPNIPQNYSLSLISRNFRNLAITNPQTSDQIQYKAPLNI